MEIVTLGSGFICIPLSKLNDNPTLKEKTLNQKILKTYQFYVTTRLHTNSYAYDKSYNNDIFTTDLPIGLVESFKESAKCILAKLKSGYIYDRDNIDDAEELNLLYWKPDLLKLVPELRQYFNEFETGLIALKPDYVIHSDGQR